MSLWLQLLSVAIAWIEGIFTPPRFDVRIFFGVTLAPFGVAAQD